MPAVMVAGPIATQNSPLLPQQWPKPSSVLIERAAIAKLSGPE